jgi:dihydroneopterin aldolase
MSSDTILISNLELSSRIGITKEERAAAQRLTVSLVLEPAGGLSGLEDRIENTVDYANVCVAVRALASAAERNLVETLAEDIARMLLSDFPLLRAVDVELRKYILKETEYVAVKIHRETPQP